MPYVNKDRLTNALFQIIVDRYPDIDVFNRSVGSRMAQFADGQQHDAQEFLTCLLDAVESSVQDGFKAAVQARSQVVPSKPALTGPTDTSNGDNAPPAQPSTPPPSPFQGKEAYVRRCTRCNFTPTPTQTPVYMASLALFPSPASIPLRTLFDHHTVSERLDDVTCDACTYRSRLQKIAAAVKSLQKDVSQATRGAMIDDHITAVIAGKGASIAEDEESEACMLQRLMKEGLATQQALNKLIPGTVPETQMYKPDVDDSFFEKLPAWAPLVPQTPVKTTSERQLVLSQLPPLLCVHFKRLAGFRKCESHVDFPVQLDLTSVRDMFRLKANLPLPESAASDAQYTLKAVVVHLGDAFGGHYVTYRRSERTMALESRGRNRVYAYSEKLGRQVPVYGDFRVEDAPSSNTEENTRVIRVMGDIVAANDIIDVAEIDGMVVSTGVGTSGDVSDTTGQGEKNERKWWLCSDLDVREVTERDVLRQNAYMLFYERVQVVEAKTEEK